MTTQLTNEQVEEIVSSNIKAVAEKLFGAEADDDDVHFVGVVCGQHYQEFVESDVDSLARLVDSFAKASGGKGWL